MQFRRDLQKIVAMHSFVDGERAREREKREARESALGSLDRATLPSKFYSREIWRTRRDPKLYSEIPSHIPTQFDSRNKKSPWQQQVNLPFVRKGRFSFTVRSCSFSLAVYNHPSNSSRWPHTKCMMWYMWRRVDAAKGHTCRPARSQFCTLRFL